MQCPSCGTLAHPSDRFCAECGHHLEDNIINMVAKSGLKDATTPSPRYDFSETAKTVSMTRERGDTSAFKVGPPPAPAPSSLKAAHRNSIFVSRQNLWMALVLVMVIGSFCILLIIGLGLIFFAA